MMDYLLIALGVTLGVIFPVLRGFVTNEFPPVGAPGLPPWVKKYGGLLLFSLVTALIVLAVYRSIVPDKDIAWGVALLLGFSWEATLEKVLTPPRAR